MSFKAKDLKGARKGQKYQLLALVQISCCCWQDVWCCSMCYEKRLEKGNKKQQLFLSGKPFYTFEWDGGYQLLKNKSEVAVYFKSSKKKFFYAFESIFHSKNIDKGYPHVRLRNVRNNSAVIGWNSNRDHATSSKRGRSERFYYIVVKGRLRQITK